MKCFYPMLNICVGLVIWLVTATACSHEQKYDLSKYGLAPDRSENSSPLMTKALADIAATYDPERPATILLPKGRYDFYPEGSSERVYYISNHDQDNPKRVGIALEHLKNVTFDGQGSQLIFHGRMLPVSVVNSTNCTLKNFSVDFENPHIAQVKIIENDAESGTITYEVAPWVHYEVRDSVLVVKGEGWEHTPGWGIAFEEKTKRIVYNTGDIAVGSKGVSEVSPRILKSVRWKNEKLVPGTVVAMRGAGRPAPGVFLSYNVNTSLNNIQIHYAEGMGLLAQMCEDILLDGFSVRLYLNNDPRYFTTQADATHFSGCKGKIISRHGWYENMMDDAINVHGTYLKVQKRIDDKTLVGEYMHPQSYGFKWGEVGDTVQFVDAKTMELIDTTHTIVSIEAIDRPVDQGVKQFRIVFDAPIDTAINESACFGIENLTWTPEVLFEKNEIRNNRARGALFSTPRPTLIQRNDFHYTSGSAILLCGDCNGWFETGACRDVVIRENVFFNALTNMFQFTNAIISIYPEIPDLESQQKYFHSGIVIEKNQFYTFDRPIVYAKSVDGLVFRDNIIRQDDAYPKFHWNKERFLLERVIHDTIKNNRFEEDYFMKKYEEYR